MRTSKARAGRSVGKACHKRWNAYGKSQGKGRRRGSPRSSTISAPTCSKRRSSNLKKMPRRRVYIPKPDGRQRPIAVAALEDKIVQRAVVALLNAIYEEDFLGFSYG